ncbi:MAG: 2-dehydro-3-deoxygalactonokinase [Herminiimonas sp.]|nr:2-dehydro-3-deoxygalactonokinase [Herminiimonas sp.]
MPAPDEPIAAPLIALDWGSSSLRAYLMRGPLDVADSRSAPWGILHLPDGGFEAALQQLCGDWLTQYPTTPVIAAGMVGSAQGWREAPYATAPAGLGDLASQLAVVTVAGGRRIAIVPGVRTGGIRPNVMRGEETQIFGVLAMANDRDAPTELLVLPGTHSKWVVAADGRIIDFLTFMTGELFAVLCEHSILGRLMPSSAVFDQAAFERGARMALDPTSPGPFSALFSVRSLGLTGVLPHSSLADYLSGLLIGTEIAEGKRAFTSSVDFARQQIHLIGDEKLCERYRRVLPLFGLHALPAVTHVATAAGLWRVALAAGLIAAR